MTIVGYDSESDTNYIQSRSNWQFVDVYTDEGISALNTKRRDGFNRMIADALAGKIDLIITKSVSRFARNTVDSLICADLKKSLTNRGICGILENNEVNRFIF